MDTNVNPVGKVSVTLTVLPLVAPDPAALLTVIVYVALLCACVKFPVCVLAIDNSGTAPTVVGSVALAEADPPPDTVTELVCEVALAATLTVTVIAG